VVGAATLGSNRSGPSTLEVNSFAHRSLVNSETVTLGIVICRRRRDELGGGDQEYTRCNGSSGTVQRRASVPPVPQCLSGDEITNPLNLVKVISGFFFRTNLPIGRRGNVDCGQVLVTSSGVLRYAPAA